MRLSLLLLPSAVVFADGFTSSSSSSLHCGQVQQWHLLGRRDCAGVPLSRGGGLQQDDLNPNASPSSSTTCLASSTSSTTDIGASAAAQKVISTSNWDLLSTRGKSALQRLIEHDLDHQHQTHVYGNWPEVGIEDEEKRMLAEQVSDENSEFVSAFLLIASCLVCV